MSKSNYPHTPPTTTPISDVRALLDFANTHHHDHQAYLFHTGSKTHTISFHQLYADVQNLSHHWRDRFRKNEPVILLGANTYWWIATLLTLLNLDQTIILAGCLSPAQLRFLIDAHPSATIITDHVHHSLVSFALTKILLLDNDTDDSVTKILTQQSTHTAESLPKIHPDHSGVIVFSSGTTSQPKAITITQTNILADIFGLSYIISNQGETLVHSCLPFDHIFGLTTNIFLLIYQNASLYLPPSRYNLQQLYQQIQPTTIITSTSAIRAQIPIFTTLRPSQIAPWLRHYYGPNLKRVIIGGDRLSPYIQKLYAAAGIQLITGYGISECAPVIACNPQANFLPSCVGLPLPNITVKIDHPDKSNCGEILIRGPIVSPGYLQTNGLKSVTDSDGYYHTGDLGSFDSQGRLYLHGRRQNMLAQSQRPINPETLENTFGALLPLADCLICQDNNQLQAHLIPLTSAKSARAHARFLKKSTTKINKTLSPLRFDACIWDQSDNFAKTSAGKIKRS